MKKILLVNEINKDTMRDLMEKCLGEEEVELLVDSTGGDPLCAIAFYSFIKSSGIKLTVNILSRCISSAVFILCAGQIRKAGRFSRILIHSVKFGTENSLTTAELEWYAKENARLDADLCKIIELNSKIPPEQLQKMYHTDTEIPAHEAFELGILTEEPY